MRRWRVSRERESWVRRLVINLHPEWPKPGAKDEGQTYGTCVDCNRTRRVRRDGRCQACGSASVIVEGRL